MGRGEHFNSFFDERLGLDAFDFTFEITVGEGRGFIDPLLLGLEGNDWGYACDLDESLSESP